MLETVTVAHPDIPGELMIINKSDFDPAVHKVYEPPAPEAPKTEGDQKPTAPEPPKTEGDQKPPEGSKSKGKAEK
jgi:hypothetical protein